MSHDHLHYPTPDQQGFVSVTDARTTVIDHLTTLRKAETVHITQAIDRVVASDLFATVDSPSLDISRMDGFAIIASDTASASQKTPVKLAIIGQSSAGVQWDNTLTQGHCIRIMTGGGLPSGATAVVPEEDVVEDAEYLAISSPVNDGKFVTDKGTDIKRGAILCEKGTVFMPRMAGYAAAGGISTVSVYTRPKIAVMALGDELAESGAELKDGQVFASNMVTVCGWLEHFRFETISCIIKDNMDDIVKKMKELLEDPSIGCILTTGGAWGSAKDFAMPAVKAVGGSVLFHRVRLGPGTLPLAWANQNIGKGVAFCLTPYQKPVFCLPGGPPSCEAAFTQIALWGIRCLAGHSSPPFNTCSAVLYDSKPYHARSVDWTQILDAKLDDGKVKLLMDRSRLGSMARSNVIAVVDEGVDKIDVGGEVHVQVM